MLIAEPVSAIAWLCASGQGVRRASSSANSGNRRDECLGFRWSMAFVTGTRGARGIGMKKVAVMGMLASLLAMVGCNKAPDDERTRQTLNPPPSPPSCARLPEVENLTLKNGAIADVRIIKIGETKLYFPSDWLADAFVDVPSKWPWERREGKSSIGMTTPDLFKDECPGVIHTLNLDRRSPGIGIKLGGQVSSADFTHEDGAISKEIRSLSVSSSEILPGSHRWLLHTSGGLKVWLIPIKDVMMYAAVSKTYGDRNVTSQSLTELAEWLATPPNTRDNARKFTVEIDKAAKQ